MRRPTRLDRSFAVGFVGWFAAIGWIILFDTSLPVFLWSLGSILVFAGGTAVWFGVTSYRDAHDPQEPPSA